MKIALLSDIHGNLPALNAVLDDMPPVDNVLCGGDIVGYNPWPVECLDRIRDVATVTVQGNHDRAVESPHEHGLNDMAVAGLEHAQSELTDDDINWLSSLPQRTEFADGTYLLAHSHPDPDQLGTYVMPRHFPKMRSYLDDCDGIVLGHTHVQHKALIDNRLIVNPGSVGQPRDNNPDAAYAILQPRSQRIEFRRVEYDIDSVISKLETLDLPVEIGTRLLEGK